MIRQRGKRTEQPKRRRQLGILFDEELWYQLRLLALKKKRTGTHLMEEAVREYLQNHPLKGQEEE